MASRPALPPPHLRLLSPRLPAIYPPRRRRARTRVLSALPSPSPSPSPPSLVSTASLDRGPGPSLEQKPRQDQALAAEVALLSAARERLRAARSLKDKLRALDAEPRVAAFFREQQQGSGTDYGAVYVEAKLYQLALPEEAKRARGSAVMRETRMKRWWSPAQATAAGSFPVTTSPRCFRRPYLRAPAAQQAAFTILGRGLWCMRVAYRNLRVSGSAALPQPRSRPWSLPLVSCANDVVVNWLWSRSPEGYRLSVQPGGTDIGIGYNPSQVTIPKETEKAAMTTYMLS